MADTDLMEPIALFEPLMVGAAAHARGALAELACELAMRAEGLRRALTPAMAAALGELNHLVDATFDGRLEGRDLSPGDVARAQRNLFSSTAEIRDFQLAAKALMTVRRWVDGGAVGGSAADPKTVREMHRRYQTALPPAHRAAAAEGAPEPAPGDLRHGAEPIAGRPLISPGAVPRFLEAMGERYGGLGRIDTLLAAAAAHHRLLWVRPFAGGNGTIARLISQAMIADALGWPVPMSLARGVVRRRDDFAARLSACDSADGGGLSEMELVRFTAFFLQTVTEEIDTIDRLTRADDLAIRAAGWAVEQMRQGHLPPKSDQVVDALMLTGSLERGAVAGLTGLSERAGRRISAALIRTGLATAPSTRAPLAIHFPAELAERLLPGLLTLGPDGHSR